MIKRRYFNLNEALEILPEVNLLLKELIELQIDIRLLEKIKLSYDDPFIDAAYDIRKGLIWYKRNYKFFKILNKLTKLGIFVKDPCIGLIDFYSKFEDKEIFLCYKYPEETISHWHNIDDGFTGRKSIDLLKKDTMI